MVTPDYLTSNQSEECPWADHPKSLPFLHPVFKNLSLKDFEELFTEDIQVICILSATFIDFAELVKLDIDTLGSSSRSFV